ncbi:ACT domain-containing protein [bacterium]|nr:ACT domain-containing protein [bacterium]
MTDVDTKIIITVVGSDKVGIVASVSNRLAQSKVNIEDIKQTIMQNNFAMIMLCDIKDMNVSFKEFQEDLTKLSKEMDLEIWIQKKELFDKMHTI